MQGIKFKYSVDALKVCYKIKEEAYRKLTFIDIVKKNDGKIVHTHNPIESTSYTFESPNYQDIYTVDFILRRVKTSRFDFEILVPDENIEGKFVLYGNFTIKAFNDSDFSGKCFITLENRRLYEPFGTFVNVLEWKKTDNKNDLSKIGSISNYTKIKQELRVPLKTIKIQYNTIFFLEEMTNRLGLELVSISSLEIALDSNINFARQIKKIIADENYIPIIKGIKYPDINSRESIKDVNFKNNTNRKRVINLSFNIRQTGLGLKCYNKTKEIEDESGKTYIYKWLDMKKNIHRIEVTAKNEVIKLYCKNSDIELSDFLYNLHTGENLSGPFNIWLNKLVHFKKTERPKGNDITIFDILKNKANKKLI